jgi:hypothetical protein
LLLTAHLFVRRAVHDEYVLATISWMNAFSEEEFQIIEILGVRIAEDVHHKHIAVTSGARRAEVLP